MFDDLIALFSGWYQAYATRIRDLLQTNSVQVIMTPDGAGDYVTQTYSTDINPAIWSAYVPWEALIATVIFVVLVVCLFRFLRSVLCKIL